MWQVELWLKASRRDWGSFRALRGDLRCVPTSVCTSPLPRYLLWVLIQLQHVNSVSCLNQRDSHLPSRWNRKKKPKQITRRNTRRWQHCSSDSWTFVELCVCVSVSLSEMTEVLLAVDLEPPAAQTRLVVVGSCRHADRSVGRGGLLTNRCAFLINLRLHCWSLDSLRRGCTVF